MSMHVLPQNVKSPGSRAGQGVAWPTRRIDSSPVTDVNSRPQRPQRPQRPRPPQPIRWAGLIAIVQSVIILAFATVGIVRDLMGHVEEDLVSDSANINWVGTGTAVFLWIIFGAAIFAAIWMMLGHQWGRGLIVFLQIIILGLAYFMFSGGAWLAGLLTGLSAIAALVLLFNRRSIEWAEATHGF